MTYPREQPYPGETEEHQRQRETGAGPDDEVYHVGTDDDGNPVKQYDMDAEEIVVTPGVHVDWNEVVSHMIEIAKRRLGEQIPYVHVAVSQFQAQSGAQIAQFIAENTPAPSVGISWKELVDGLIEGVGIALFPEAEFAKVVFETASKFLVGNLEKIMEETAHPLEDARAKLEAGVGAFVTQVEQNTVTAVDEAKAQVEHVIRQGMADQHNPTNDPAWIDEMVHWMGFPERSEATVTAPVLQWLTYQFTALLSQVQQEMHAELH
jgi:hypothetical protein